MKKLLVIALAFCTLSTFAQDNNADTTEMMKKKLTKSDFSAEDRAEMQTKRMTLRLDLTEEQQSKVKELLTAHFKENEDKFRANKKSRKDMSEEERRDVKMEMLDSQIALKEQMKSVLNDEQYAQYSQILNRYMKKGKGKKKGKR